MYLPLLHLQHHCWLHTAAQLQQGPLRRLALPVRVLLQEVGHVVQHDLAVVPARNEQGVAVWGLQGGEGPYVM
jgi:hypothetical protein